MKHTFILTLHTQKPIADLTDIIQQRVYMLEGIDKRAEMSCQQVTGAKISSFNVEFVGEEDGYSS